MKKHKTERKIQDYDKWYFMLRHYVDFSLFQAYRKIEYEGLDKIPNDGALILAPNHTNALMDALVVLSYDKQPKVFVARADIFRNPKIAKILKFLKMMPIMRIRDGMEEVRKNNETIEKAVEVLSCKVPFCILPEGTHRAQHSLLPLSKGIFRIAIQAQEMMSDTMPLYIVPFGLEYGNFFRFRSTVLVQIGDPINVREYMHKHSDLTHPELMNILKDDLSSRLKSVILYIPDDEYYDATYEYCALMVNYQEDMVREANEYGHRSLKARLLANRKTSEEIQKLREINPESAKELLEKGNQFRTLRTQAGISLSSVVMKYPLWSRTLKNLLFIVSLPYTIAASVLVLPISLVSRLLFKKMKDRAFFNSIRYVVTLILWPILILIYGIVFFSLLPWQWAIFACAAAIPANIIAQDAFHLLRVMVSDLKLLFNRPLMKRIKDLRKLYIAKTQAIR